MTAMRRLARRLRVDEAGATAIEYALLAALIAGVLIATVFGLGQTVGGIYTKAQGELAPHVPASSLP
jgi:Flp pilus assembly pilin Flp